MSHRPYEPNDSFAQAAGINPGVEYTAYICGSGDWDFFEFYVVAGQEITIDLYGVVDDLPGHYDVELLGPDEGYAGGSHNAGTTTKSLRRWKRPLRCFRKRQDVDTTSCAPIAAVTRSTS